MYIVDPFLRWDNWDQGTMNKDKSPGHHMICDMNGNGLKYKDVKSGMSVKIKTKHPHHEK